MLLFFFFYFFFVTVLNFFVLNTNIFYFIRKLFNQLSTLLSNLYTLTNANNTILVNNWILCYNNHNIMSLNIVNSQGARNITKHCTVVEASILSQDQFWGLILHEPLYLRLYTMVVNTLSNKFNFATAYITNNTKFTNGLQHVVSSI